MAGRRRERQTREVMVARREARAATLKTRLADAAGHPTRQVAVAADYLRGAIACTGRDVPAEASAAAREAVRVLADLADQLFNSAVAKRRTRS